MDLPIAIGVCIVVLIAAATDLWRRKIYNWLTFPAMLAALTYHTITYGFSGLGTSLLGFLAGLGLMLLPFILGRMGAGDVKLLAAVGAALGPVHVFWAFVCLSLAGGAYALIILAIQTGIRVTNLNEALVKLAAMGPSGLAADLSRDSGRKMCYGVPMAVGIIGYIVVSLTGLWVAPWT